MQSAGALVHYLRSVRHLTGAATASLLLCPGADAEAARILLHEGDLEPVPEFATEAAVRSFLAGAERPAPRPEAPPLLRCYPSSAADGRLLRVFPTGVTPALQPAPVPDLSGERRRLEPPVPAAAFGARVWLGLRYGNRHPAPLLDEIGNDPSSPTPGERMSGGHWLAWNLAFGIYMAGQLYQLSRLLRDPVSRLPGRMEFQAYLKQALVDARRDRRPLALALINPDNFGLVNNRLGTESGDAAVRELADRLQTCLRHSDALFRYGGAVFGLVMPAIAAAAAEGAAERMRLALSQQDFLEGAVRLTFSIGVTVYAAVDGDPPPLDADELMRRADQALNAAKLSGGGRTLLWEPGGLASAVGNLDRLSGIFTADTEKDYRNMLLLWETVTVITSHAETHKIATAFVERASATFKPRRAGLFAETKQGAPRLLAASQGARDGGRDRGEFPLSDKQQGLLSQARKRRRIERLRLDANARGEPAGKVLIAYAVPLLAREKYLGCLYLDGPEGAFLLDSSDLIFFGALANQVAVALDRAELALRWKQEQQRESRRLREEVRGLRNALQHSRLVYRSSQMQSLLDTLRRVAPTDATVLVTGESGTGKELLARALHEHSRRHNRAFVVVDCGAIAQSLMDAELFGHVKGAFTGAQEASKGRIAQADGGTLFLDEIGELPLEVQAKLLRFVQEKEFTPVGSASARQVDVRIVAATNRDLAAEADAGTFRRDLYYRLQVVTVTAPPLRARPDDILPLAHYFLEKFAVQYEQGRRHLSPEAEAALRDYNWPGNVRELQNRMLQAIVMSGAEEIERADLNLGDPALQAPTGGSQPPPPAVSGTPVPAGRPPAAAGEAPSAADAGGPEDGASLGEVVRQGLGRQVSLALDGGNGSAIPLGRWLTTDLVLAADAAANGVARRASAALGMAETTFRRQLDKARRESQAGLSLRTPEWAALRPLLSRLVAAAPPASGHNLIEQANRLLLEEVVAQVPRDDNLGSLLLGVSKPTYQRRKTALAP